MSRRGQIPPWRRSRQSCDLCQAPAQWRISTSFEQDPPRLVALVCAEHRGVSQQLMLSTGGMAVSVPVRRTWRSLVTSATDRAHNRAEQAARRWLR